MAFCFLKIITSIQRIKPGVKEEFCPVSLPNDQAPLTQSFTVLREKEIYLVTSQVRKGLDHTIGRHDGDVPEHQLLKPFGCQEVGDQIEVRFHDQGMRRKRKEVFGMWVYGHGVAERGYKRPAARRPIDVVFASNREKSCVAYKWKASHKVSTPRFPGRELSPATSPFFFFRIDWEREYRENPFNTNHICLRSLSCSLWFCSYILCSCCRDPASWPRPPQECPPAADVKRMIGVVNQAILGVRQRMRSLRPVEFVFVGLEMIWTLVRMEEDEKICVVAERSASWLLLCLRSCGKNGPLWCQIVYLRECVRSDNLIYEPHPWSGLCNSPLRDCDCSHKLSGGIYN